MARTRSEQGPAFEVVEADILTWEAPEPFTLVLDSGCMHNLSHRSLSTYREQVLRWLAPNGAFVLEHWDKRHRFDWRPMGPHRRPRARIEALFQPLTLVESVSNEFDVDLPIGPRVKGTGYHFARA